VTLLRTLTRTEIGDLAPRATAVLPVAAIEQHGPHLPVWVDTMVGERIAGAAAERIGDRGPVLVCPVMPFGASHHHLIYPGALSLSTDTLLRVLSDLVDSLVASGFRRIFLLNSHGGNEEVVRLTARELALRHPVVAGAASYWTLAWKAMIDEGDALAIGRVPGHAGGFETSLALALAPDLVRRDLLPLPRRGPGLRTPIDPAGQPMVQRHGSWRGSDGYSDDASDASAERGAALFELIVREVAAALLAFHQQPAPDDPGQT
jgi:creatinine amidohydrolase